MVEEGWGRFALRQWSQCLKERVQSEEVSLTHRPQSVLLNMTFLLNACIYTQRFKKVRHACIYICVYVRVWPPHPHPTSSLNPCGRGCKRDGWNLVVVSVYLLCLSLLSERNKSHVGDAAWGLRVHPSSSSFFCTPSLPTPSTPHSPIFFPAPHKDSIEERKCLVDA